MSIKTARITNTVFPRYLWENLESGDTITPVPAPQQYGLAGSVQITGAFGSATVSVEVSHDGDNWFDLADLSGEPVAMTEAGYAEFSSSALYFRPKLTGANGTTSVVVSLVFRGNHAL